MNKNEIARYIIRNGNCNGIGCTGNIFNVPIMNIGINCPLADRECGWKDGNNVKMVLAASKWIQDNEEGMSHDDVPAGLQGRVNPNT